MPLYEYECDNCTSSVEKLLPTQGIQDSQFCPRCGCEMRLVPSAPAWFPAGKYGKGGG